MKRRTSPRKLRVLLINPPQIFKPGYQPFNAYFPLGVLSLAASIRDIATVKVLDCLNESFEALEEEPGVFRYGTPEAYIESVVRAFKPDIVGLSCPFSVQLPNSVKLAAMAKRLNPRTLVVLGGPHASVKGSELLGTYPDFDISVVGEGEHILREIVRRYKGGSLSGAASIRGIHYRTRGKTAFTGPADPIMDMDSLPLPAYDLVDMESYKRNPYLYKARSVLPTPSISVITSRGCPFKCVFCSVHLHMGRMYRGHSPEYVIRHLTLLKQKYGLTNIHFEDDNISINRLRFEKLLDALIGADLGIRWDTPNGLRADTLSKPLLEKMRLSGAVRLTIAIESGNQKILDTVVHKRLNLEVAKQVAAWCHELGIGLSAFYIIGFPGETVAEMKDTVDLALDLYRRYGVAPSLFVATPLYGTELYDICDTNGYFAYPITEENLGQGTQLNGKHLIRTPDFGEKEIDGLASYYRSRFRMIRYRRGITKIISAVWRS